MIAHQAESQDSDVIRKGQRRHSVHPEDVVFHILEDYLPRQSVRTDVPVTFFHSANIAQISRNRNRLVIKNLRYW